MTVQEMLDKLNAVEDKTLEVSFPYWAGTRDNGDPIPVSGISVAADCVIIY